jgi:excisionase family DNA binding protein
MPETAKSASDSPCTETPGHRTVRRTAAHVAPSPNDQPDSLKVSEVAAILRVSPTTIYKLTRLEEFQCVHVGGSMQIPRTSFEEFTARTVRTR